MATVEIDRDALLTYIEWQGAMHEKGCPCDDTCECQGATVNEAIGKAIRESYQKVE